MIPKFKVLIVGLGSIGERHLRNFSILGVRQLAYVDPNVDADALRLLAPEIQAQRYETLDKALTEFQPQIVFICSPTKYHIQQALESVRCGAHVFIEKPISHTVEVVDELANEARKKKVFVMVACNMRFYPGPQKVKELIEAQSIGTVIAARLKTGSYLPSWRPQQDYRKSYSADKNQGGAILDCIHEIDLALWYSGPATLQSAITLPATHIGLDVDGLAEILLRHDSGVVTSLHLNFIQKNIDRYCEIVGSSGTIRWDFVRGCVELFGESGKLESLFEQPADWERNHAYIREIFYFLECLQKNITPMSSVEEGKAALDIALAAQKYL